MQVFRAILKDNDENTPSIFIKENSFITDSPLEFVRHSNGYYAVEGFRLNGDGVLDREKTEIYFGRGTDPDCARFVKREPDSESPSHQISVFTHEANGDGTFSPADGYLNYESITIILHS